MTEKARQKIWVLCLYCVISGLLLGISQPIYMPLLFGAVGEHQSLLGLLALIGYVPLFLAIADKNLKATFLLTFLAITVQLTIVLYWIYIALHVYGNIPIVFSAIITLILPMVLALMGATFFTVGRFLSQRFNISFLLIAPLALTSFEYFRNFYIFGGFPWGNVGYSIGRIDQFLQAASLFGVYGLVFFVGVINSLFALAISAHSKKDCLRYIAVSAAILLAGLCYGSLRIASGKNEFAPSIRVALLQGNIPQEFKNARSLHADDILKIYRELHKKAKDMGADLIVWPESSYPRMLSKDITDLDFSYEDRAASVIGAVVYGENENKTYYVQNSALLLNRDGRVAKRYDKSHLVPFGEYVPWPMNGVVDKIVPGMGAFRPGIEFIPQKLALSESKDIKVGTTVCYEGIFPEISRTYAKNGATVLVNVTNDAWYGESSAPYQHLLMYRLRSVESGLPFLRATNTGLTAWVDAYGNVHQTLKLFERGLMVDNVPLIQKRTVYVALGDVIPIAALIILIIGYVLAVLPVYTFVKMRQWHKIAVILGFCAIVVGSEIYFTQKRFLTDESSRTKSLLIFLLCLLIMIGFLARTHRSRSILLVSSLILMAFSLLLSIFESPYFLLGLVLGLLIYLLAFRIKKGDQPIK